MNAIREAILRLSCIEQTQFNYDPAGRVLGDGPIHYMIEIGDIFLIAWSNNATGTMIVNPITRFSLDELTELGEEDAWTVLRIPAELIEGIQFREIDEKEMIEVYQRMDRRVIAAVANSMEYEF